MMNEKQFEELKVLLEKILQQLIEVKWQLKKEFNNG